MSGRFLFAYQRFGRWSKRGVWELFDTILKERKRREIDPTLALLKTCTDQARKTEDEHCEARLGELLEFFETMTECYDAMRHLPPEKLRKLLRLGGRVGGTVAKLLP